MNDTFLFGGYIMIIAWFITMICLDEGMWLSFMWIWVSFLLASNQIESKAINDKLDTIIKELQIQSEQRKGDTNNKSVIPSVSKSRINNKSKVKKG